MDFVQGGDFFTFMRKFGKLREPWVQLYICEIALALQVKESMLLFCTEARGVHFVWGRGG